MLRPRRTSSVCAIRPVGLRTCLTPHAWRGRGHSRRRSIENASSSKGEPNAAAVMLSWVQCSRPKDFPWQPLSYRAAEKTREVGVTTLRTARVEDPAFYVFRSCDTQSRFAQLVAVSEQLFSEGDCCAAPGVFPSSQFVKRGARRRADVHGGARRRAEARVGARRRTSAVVQVQGEKRGRHFVPRKVRSSQVVQGSPQRSVAHAAVFVSLGTMACEISVVDIICEFTPICGSFSALRLRHSRRWSTSCSPLNCGFVRVTSKRVLWKIEDSREHHSIWWAVRVCPRRLRSTVLVVRSCLVQFGRTW